MYVYVCVTIFMYILSWRGSVEA